MSISPARTVYAHSVLIIGVIFMITPILLILFSSTHETSTLRTHGLQLTFGGNLVRNYQSIFSFETGFTDQVTPLVMLSNSLMIAFGVAILTTLFSFASAYAIVFFRMRAASFLFWMILLTLLFPLESRFITTFQVTSTLGLINTHLGIILPTLAAALGTFFFRQHFLMQPKELIEAASLDGAGPWKFMVDIIMPLSLARAGIVFVISFIIGWNQYLWPVMISTDDSLYTLVRGIALFGRESGPGMALIVLTMLPPFLLLLIFQRWLFTSLNNE